MQIPLPQGHFSIPITADGILDAIAVWFHLHLDHTNTISTAPSQHTTWEQAIFPIPHILSVSKGDMVTVAASCTDTLISVEVQRVYSRDQQTSSSERGACSNNGGCKDDVSSDRETDDKNSEGSCFSSEGKHSSVEGGSNGGVHFIERGDLLRLNDPLYMSAYHRAIVQGVKHVRQASESYTDDSAGCIVLDLTQGLSLFGLVAAKEGKSLVTIGPPISNTILQMNQGPYV